MSLLVYSDRSRCVSLEPVGPLLPIPAAYQGLLRAAEEHAIEPAKQQQLLIPSSQNSRLGGNCNSALADRDSDISRLAAHFLPVLQLSVVDCLFLSRDPCTICSAMVVPSMLSKVRAERMPL